MTKGTAVLVTTDKDKRGVFAGKFVSRDELQIKLQHVRMVNYWSEDVKGVLGLAATGPTSNCKISKAVESAVLEGVTAVFKISDKAWEAFELEPWSR